jgi:hypothetical protein
VAHKPALPAAGKLTINPAYPPQRFHSSSQTTRNPSRNQQKLKCTHPARVHVSFCARWHRVDFVNREFHVVFSPKSLAELAPNLQCVKQHRPVRREDRLLVALAGEAARESASQTAHFPQSLDRKRRCWVLQKLTCTHPARG